MKLPWYYRFSGFWYKASRFEFWPTWLFYPPVFLYYLWLSLKSWSFCWFTTLNPAIEHGGFLGESKKKIMASIPDEYLPKTLHFSEPLTEQNIQEIENTIGYPCIIKPDQGERGDGVEVVYQQEQLRCYSEQMSEYMIQEYIDWSFEAGVFIVDHPHHERKVTSIVYKEFLQVKGDGKRNLRELIWARPRSRFQWPRLYKNNQFNWEEVLPVGEIKLLEPIGNHCRGTTFRDGNQLWTSEVESFFTRLQSRVEGFHFGRLDIKAKSIESFQRGEDMVVMELNGMLSEPGHIYDPNYRLWSAYRSMFQHWRWMYEISIVNYRKGLPRSSFLTMWNIMISHLGQVANKRSIAQSRLNAPNSNDNNRN